MTIRTSETMATFLHPFMMSSIDGVMPAGTYRIVMDEEEIPGLSFLAFRRVSTMLHVPAISKFRGPNQLVPVDQSELDEALAKDESRAS